MSEEVRASTHWKDDAFVNQANDGTRTRNSYAAAGAGAGLESWRPYAVEFGKGLVEMSVEFGKGVRDVVKQTVLREDSLVVRNLRGPCKQIAARLRFLNDYLPEDRDPLHAWTVICFVVILAIAVLYVNSENESASTLIKKVNIHPSGASRILLPDGRYMAYLEQGVPAGQARFSMIASHSFLSSRLAGMPGIKASLLQEFGIRFIAYDLPGFGESDPHPNRDLESSAMDVLYLSYAVNVTDKFWVMGYSSGSMHTWAALKYIPDRVAGAVMIAPMVNPYEPRMTKQERRRTWGKWKSKRKLMYILARRFPRFLSFLYRRSFLSGYHGQIEKWLPFSLGYKDRTLVETEMFEEFWQRDLEESVRQGKVKPFVEEAVLQVSNWGFSIADLKVQKKHKGNSFFIWIKSLYSQVEEDLTGFIGPIHVWQGMDDLVVPPSIGDFVQRVLPQVMVHKLLYEGHFTYFYFCDECHRQIFSTIFGHPQGPLVPKVEQIFIEEGDGDTQEVLNDDLVTHSDYLGPCENKNSDDC